eukprot:jgi/Mesvir1/9022/Mv21307-RA.1
MPGNVRHGETLTPGAWAVFTLLALLASAPERAHGHDPGAGSPGALDDGSVHNPSSQPTPTPALMSATHQWPSADPPAATHHLSSADIISPSSRSFPDTTRSFSDHTASGADGGSGRYHRTWRSDKASVPSATLSPARAKIQMVSHLADGTRGASSGASEPAATGAAGLGGGGGSAQAGAGTGSGSGQEGGGPEGDDVPPPVLLRARTWAKSSRRFTINGGEGGGAASPAVESVGDAPPRDEEAAPAGQDKAKEEELDPWEAMVRERKRLEARLKERKDPAVDALGGGDEELRRAWSTWDAKLATDTQPPPLPPAMPKGRGGRIKPKSGGKPIKLGPDAMIAAMIAAREPQSTAQAVPAVPQDDGIWDDPLPVVPPLKRPPRRKPPPRGESQSTQGAGLIKAQAIAGVRKARSHHAALAPGARQPAMGSRGPRGHLPPNPAPRPAKWMSTLSELKTPNGLEKPLKPISPAHKVMCERQRAKKEELLAAEAAKARVDALAILGVRPLPGAVKGAGPGGALVGGAREIKPVVVQDERFGYYHDEEDEVEELMAVDCGDVDEYITFTQQHGVADGVPTVIKGAGDEFTGVPPTPPSPTQAAGAGLASPPNELLKAVDGAGQGSGVDNVLPDVQVMGRRLNKGHAMAWPSHEKPKDGKAAGASTVIYPVDPHMAHRAGGPGASPGAAGAPADLYGTLKGLGLGRMARLYKGKDGGGKG